MPENQLNLTDAQKLVVGIAYSEGRRIGKQLFAAIDSGELIIPENQTIEILLDSFVNYEFVPYQKFLATVLGPKTYAGANLCWAGGGLAIVGESIVRYYKTGSIVSKFCYVSSAFLGGSAAIAGSVRACSGLCGMSHIAMGGDILGGSFLWVGNRFKDAGDLIDGKKSVNPFRRRNFVRRPIAQMGAGYKGLSFVPNSSISLTEVLTNIPYTEIIVIGGTVFTVYRSTKLVIKYSRSLYSYVKKKYSPKLNYSHLALFTAKSLIKVYSTDRVSRICYLAVQLQIQ